MKTEKGQSLLLLLLLNANRYSTENLQFCGRQRASNCHSAHLTPPEFHLKLYFLCQNTTNTHSSAHINIHYTADNMSVTSPKMFIKWSNCHGKVE